MITLKRNTPKMKKILITGANSYIGICFKEWLKQWPNDYLVDAISVRGNSWKEKSFTGYDSVLHLAAVVHVEEKNIDRYFKINRDLTVNIAEKARNEGVKQFIFLSTMAVYGCEMGYITAETHPMPKTFYAKSKYEAEKLLLNMENDKFKIAILRPPIVYGKGCRGNYPRLANLVTKLPIFPDVDNIRSMIYIDNLSEFIRIIVNNYLSGVFFPQNEGYVNITELARLINLTHGKNIRVTKSFNWAIAIGLKFSKTIQKVFGNLVYDKRMPGGPGTVVNGIPMEYETTSFKESIMLTES